MVSEGYKQRLSEWIDRGRKKYGSYQNFATAITIAAGEAATKDMLLIWHKQKYKKDLPNAMLKPLAAYAGQSIEDFRLWLEHGNQGTQGGSTVTQDQILSISDPTELLRIQDWIIDRMRFLLSGPTKSPEQPTTIDALREYLRQNTEAVAMDAEIAPERVQSIGEGTEPTANEMARLAIHWGIDGTWLKRLYTPPKTPNPAGAATARRSKTQPAKPPVGTA
jgi:hypothetical protein